MKTAAWSCGWPSSTWAGCSRGACQRYIDRARLREQSLVLDVQPGTLGIYADGELLSRLVENLLDNAIKYAPPGTLIRAWRDLTASPSCQDASRHGAPRGQPASRRHRGPRRRLGPHRAEAFTACRAVIEALKRDVSICKKELCPDGSEWLG